MNNKHLDASARAHADAVSLSLSLQVYDCAIKTKEGTVIHALKRYSAFAQLQARLRATLPVSLCAYIRLLAMVVRLTCVPSPPAPASQANSRSSRRSPQSFRLPSFDRRFSTAGGAFCNTGFVQFCCTQRSEDVRRCGTGLWTSRDCVPIVRSLMLYSATRPHETRVIQYSIDGRARFFLCARLDDHCLGQAERPPSHALCGPAKNSPSSLRTQ